MGAMAGILAGASGAFKAMFFGEMERPTMVEIPDGTPEAFCVLLQ